MDAQREPAVICLVDDSRAARNAMLAADCVAARLDRRLVALRADSAEALRRTAIEEPGELALGSRGHGAVLVVTPAAAGTLARSAAAVGVGR